MEKKERYGVAGKFEK